MTRIRPILMLVVVLGAAPWLSLTASGQGGASPGGNVDAATRQSVLDSEGWRQTQRKFDEWLSVQQIYSQEEVAALQEDYRKRIAQMSPPELEDFRKEMDERLTVLMSPEAEEARRWLAQILTVARDPAAHLGREIPDVANMTASQIRQELLWIDQRRANSRQSQAAFDRGRAMKLEAAQERHAANRQAQEHARDLRTEAARPRMYRSAYSPQRNNQPGPDPRFEIRSPVYRVGPWGTPIRWDPFHDRNR